MVMGSQVFFMTIAAALLRNKGGIYRIGEESKRIERVCGLLKNRIVDVIKGYYMTERIKNDLLVNLDFPE